MKKVNLKTQDFDFDQEHNLRRISKPYITYTSLGLVLLVALMLVALFAPYIAYYDPVRASLNDAMQPPSINHPLGTDYLGRDLLSRLIYGTRVSMIVGITAALIAVGLGVIIG